MTQSEVNMIAVRLVAGTATVQEARRMLSCLTRCSGTLLPMIRWNGRGEDATTMQDLVDLERRVYQVIRGR